MPTNPSLQSEVCVGWGWGRKSLLAVGSLLALLQKNQSTHSWGFHLGQNCVWMLQLVGESLPLSSHLMSPLLKWIIFFFPEAHLKKQNLPVTCYLAVLTSLLQSSVMNSLLNIPESISNVLSWQTQFLWDNEDGILTCKVGKMFF